MTKQSKVVNNLLTNNSTYIMKDTSYLIDILSQLFSGIQKLQVSIYKASKKEWMLHPFYKMQCLF